MGLKLSITGASTASGTVDVDIDVPSGTTVGTLAAQLAASSPYHDSDAVTLAVRHGATSGTPVDPTAELAEAGIISGSSVDLVAPNSGSVSSAPEPAAAVMVVTAGPDAGARFPLRRGSTFVGRDPSCEIVLTDDMVSRRHLRIEVGDVIDVVDLGSVNGTIVDGSQVPQARIGPTTEILAGDTTFRVESHAALAPVSNGAFVRSPPDGIVFAPGEHAAPRVPGAPKPGRIPVIAAFAPLVLGAVMYVVTRRVESLIFVALSPVMLVGTAVESRVSGRRRSRRTAEQFRRELATFEAAGRRHLDDETAARRREHPPLSELEAALHGRTPTLWSRRPDGEHFGEIAVGRGRQPARTSFTSQRTEEGSADLVGELDAAMQSLTHVDQVPVVVDLTVDGSIGVAGPSDTARRVAASMVTAAALLHSPAELVVTLVSSESAEPDWHWLTWLPHVDARYAPFDGCRLASSTAGGSELHGSLTVLLEARTAASGGHQRGHHLPLVLLVVEDDAPVDRSLLVDVLERGPAVGIHTIWVAGAVDRLPAGCGAVVDASAGPDALALRIRRSKDAADAIRADTVGPVDVERIARALSPLIDIGARTRDDSGLPDIVHGPDLLGIPPDAPPEMILERWSQTSIEAARHHDTGLRAAVGIANGEPFVLDLRAHGPHALVGGTTGAGKSEFLQAWVMGLAASFSPQRVNFLFVDYKGGSAFSECVKLPHCVGLVTDLSPQLVDRALTSLHAELHRREQLFGALDAKDIHELERRGAAETPPALLIVIDEFAALVQEVPDFVNGVVNVAQRGRSLGLHLVLATQRPAGVITGNLRANTNLRVALRMADESDSSDVIDVGDAAFIDAGAPGRGFAKVGPGRTFAFQSAFYGGWSTAASNEQQIVVRPLTIGIATPWPTRQASRVAIDQPNDLARLVTVTQRAALVGQHPAPRRPWLPELPTDLDLRESPLTRSDAEIVFGSCDLPAHQAQPPISFFPDRDGNLAVFGATGSGKSALLRTIAMVAGSTAEAPETGDGPCHVYCIDFGSRSLQLLDDFSHVGAVINADDHERIARVIRELRSAIDERQRRYQSADADTIAQYREHTGHTAEPRILLMVDNFGAFRQAYDSPDRAGVLDMLLSVMADGRSVGVHVVLSADRPGAVPSAVMSLVSRRLALRLANEGDYLLLGEPANVLDGDTPPGRGVEGGREFQVAVLGGTGNIAEQMRLSRALARHDGFVADREPAPPVRRLPPSVRLTDLPFDVGGRPTLGLDDATLSPTGFEPTGAFVVAGPPGSGRTTAMGAIAVSIARHQPSIQRVLFAERRSSLAPLARWTTVAERPREHAEVAAAITADLLAVDGEVSGLAIFVENVTEALEQAEAEAALTELIKTALAHDAFVVVEGEVSQLARAWKLDVVKNQRTGLLLQPQPGDGDLLKVNLPRAPHDQFPAGRGFSVARRNVAKVQVAVPDAE